MSGASPDVLIIRHVEKLLAQSDNERVQRVLSRAGLILSDGKISGSGGGVTVDDCSTYKRAVREIYGDTAFAFAKVNFVLGGCTCQDCTS